MESFVLDLGVSSLDSPVSALLKMAGCGDSLASAMEAVGAATLKAANAADALANHYERALAAAKGLASVSTAPSMVSVATGGGGGSSSGGGSKGAKGTAEQLAEAQAAQAKLTAAATEAQIHDAAAKIARLEKRLDNERKSMFVGPMYQAPAEATVKEARFAQGPYQRLAEILRQKAEAQLLPEGAHKDAVLADNFRAETLARRNAALHERRTKDLDAYINGKGFLELFKDLNGLLGAIQGKGGAVAVVTNLAKGIDLLREAPGGLNISQKLARSIGGPAAAGTGAAISAADAVGVGAGGSAIGAILTDLAPPLLLLTGFILGAIVAFKVLQLALHAVVAVISAVGRALGAVFETGVRVVQTFLEAIRDAAGRMREFGAAGIQSGGSVGQIARLVAMGLSPGSIPSMASGVRESLTAGGSVASMIAAQRVGAGPLGPSWMGDQNFAGSLEKVIDGLRRLTGDEQRQAARGLGLEGILPLLNVSGDMAGAQRKDASVQAMIGTDAAQKQANDLGAAFNRLSFNMGTLLEGFGVGAFQPITQGLMAIGDLLRDLGAFMGANPGLAAAIGDGIRDGILAIIAWVRKLPDHLKPILDTASGFVQTIARWTLALLPGALAAMAGIAKFGLTLVAIFLMELPTLTWAVQKIVGILSFVIKTISVVVTTLVNAILAPFKIAAFAVAEVFGKWLPDEMTAGMKRFGKSGFINAFDVVAGVTKPMDQFARNDKLPGEIHAFTDPAIAVIAEVFGMIGSKVPEGVTKGLQKLTTADFAKALEAANARTKNAQDANSSALDRNTSAVEANNQILQQGSYARDTERANGALPSKLRGIGFSEAVIGRTLRLGAFSL